MLLKNLIYLNYDLFTLMSLQTCTTFFLLQNIKDILILNNIGPH